MENNEEVTVDETVETSSEDVKDETKDWKAEALKYKAIADRKDKKLKEALTDGTEPEAIIKPNTEQSVFTIEHGALMQQGANVEKLNIAETLVKVEREKGNAITLTDAYNSPIAQATFADMDSKEKLKANSLGASTGSAPATREKTVGNMTDAEHREMAEAKLANAING